jgi:hypothetical protein
MRGERQDAIRKQNQLMNLEHKGVLQNLKLKQKARRKLSREYLSSLSRLLEGTQQILSRDDHGRTEVFVLRDNTALAEGLDHFRKTIDLERPKGAPLPTTVVNVSQQQAAAAAMEGAGRGAPRGTSFEEMLTKIKQGQENTRPLRDAPGQIIDAEVEEG